MKLCKGTTWNNWLHLYLEHAGIAPPRLLEKRRRKFGVVLLDRFVVELEIGIQPPQCSWTQTA
jgi:hypothetical protein